MIGLFVVVILAALTMLAQPPGGFIRFSPLLSAIDSDHDGVISASEIANASKALLTLDRNGDGKLTEEEMRPNFGRGPGGPGRPEGRRDDPAADLVKALMAFDKNGDGKLSKDELPERMQGVFERGDANKDGFLTVDEITRMAAAQAPAGGRERGGEREGRGPGGPGGPGGFMRNDPVMSALDANHDGTLSVDEIRNAPAALKTLDKNGDGKLTEDEVRPIPPPRREQ